MIPCAQWDWGDGAYVSDDAKKCSVQTGNARQVLRAKVGLRRALFFP